MPFLPVVLDVVHRLVGGLDEPLGRRGHVGQRRHAHGHGQMNVQPVALQKPVRVDALANTLADRRRAFAAGVGQDQRELVAAEARDHVGLARALANQPRRLDQRAAAVQVAVRVVDRLEPVEVDEQQRQRPAAARGALGFPAQHLRQVARVVELRQVVGDRQRLGARDSSARYRARSPPAPAPAGAPPASPARTAGSRADGALSSPTSAPTVRPRHSSGKAIAAR